MRTGAEYIEALREGRRLWLLGEGPVEDVTAHPRTRPMVEYYARWFDRHHDPRWADLFLTRVGTEPAPRAFTVPESVEDLRRLSALMYTTCFETGANVTHTPLYGALIALGALDAVRGGRLPPERIEAARAFRDSVTASMPFVTYSSGTPPLSDRFLEVERGNAARVVRQTPTGVVLSGVVGLHTASPFADDVVIQVGSRSHIAEHKAWVALALASPGVTIVARQSAHRRGGTLEAPFSNRFDELDAGLVLDDVEVPWERVFAVGPEAAWLFRDSLVPPLLWHQQVGWLARLEFTLGLALAVAHAEGTVTNPGVVARLVDLVIDAQTVRSLLTAAELDPERTRGGHLLPRVLHLAPAALYTLEIRKRVPEILRLLCSSSALLAPGTGDLEPTGDPLSEAVRSGIERMLSGGPYTAEQRAVLFNGAWDHISSILAGREHSFELFGSGGVGLWRARIQRLFDRYGELAQGVLEVLELDGVEVNLNALRVPGAPPSGNGPNR